MLTKFICGRQEIVQLEVYRDIKECNLVKSAGFASDLKNVNYEILMPCLNSEATIEKSILSALAQSLPPRRITIHDNNSTDSSKNIVKRLAREHRHLYLVEHDERVNALISYKRCLRDNLGRVLILASDDLLAPDAVKRLIQLAECNNECHSIVPQQIFVNNGTLIRGANFGDISRTKNPASTFLINPADNPFMYGIHDAQALLKLFPTLEFYGWDLWITYNMLKSSVVHFVPNEVIYVRNYSKRSKYKVKSKDIFKTYLPLIEFSKKIWKHNKRWSRVLLVERLIFLNFHQFLSLNRYEIDEKATKLFRKVLEIRLWNRRYRKRLFEKQTNFDSQEINTIRAISEITML